ncbi:MAG TPA: C45 family autoproteolytic acyltransferase/hydrolase [Candidatus Brocadiia bacterium]|nr:C45 family autoproteolytic acyltransferase/hydrolase [Candidatus Brocadiia bacterium]
MQRRFSLARLFLAFSLLLLSACAAQTQQAPVPAVKKVSGPLVAQEGPAKLWVVNGQRVLLLQGSPKEMGRQHGKLMANEVRQDVQDLLSRLDHAGAPKEQVQAKLTEIWKSLEPNVPQQFKEELEGLAEGSGVPLADLQLIHAFPSMHHCTCAAATGKATVEGKTYFARSLDYDLDIGNDHVLQDNATLIVYKPDNGIPHANVAWAGFIGSISGMNAEGIAIADMTSDTKDESFDGMPMIFLIRKVLWEAKTADEAVLILKAGPRASGFNYMIADGKAGQLRAVEAAHSAVEVFTPDSYSMKWLPHTKLVDCVWRSNHFISPELAKGQRDVYDPRNGPESDSWLRYFIFGQFLKENHGKIDEMKMFECLRQYAVDEPALHQIVFSPSSLELSVANADNPKNDKFPGAMNNDFYRYSLSGILEGSVDSVKKVELPPRPEGQWPASGKISVKNQLPAKPPADEATTAKLKPFLPEPKDFQWIADPVRIEEGIPVYRVRFPSPMSSAFAENNMVWCEYYLPPIPEGEKRPGVVVLHILDGRFRDSRLISLECAKLGTPALMMKLPLYGERRPQPEAQMMMYIMMKKETAAKEWLYQAVADVRRARDWMANRPEVDRERVGLCGVSLGGFTTALTIGVDGNVPRALVALAGGDFATLTKKGEVYTKDIVNGLKTVGITEKGFQEILDTADPLRYAARVDGSKVSMLAAYKDSVVPKENTTALWEAYGKPKITWYPSDHDEMEKYFVGAAKEIALQFSKEVWPAAPVGK